MTDSGRSASLLVRGLALGSAALGVPMLARTDAVAELAGVDDDASSRPLIRAVGVRDLVAALLLLAGGRRSVWFRVAGDAADLALDDDVLVRRAAAEVGEALGADPLRPVAAEVSRWTDALPQYPPGHADRVAAVRAALAGHPGLAVCGAAYDGVGVPVCIASAQAAAARVAAHLEAGGQSPA